MNVGGGWGEEKGTYVECFGPLVGGDLSFGFAHAEEDTACFAVGGANFLIVQGVGVVEGDHVSGENGGIVDGCQAETATWRWLLLVLGICSRLQGLQAEFCFADFDGDRFGEGTVDDLDHIVVVFG